MSLLILDCTECQARSSCTLEQKARAEPCPSIEPSHCGLTMKNVRVERGTAGPQITFACKCGERGTAHTHRPPSREKKHDFRDPVLETPTDGHIPEELV
jgi:hypothetical protein